MAIKELNIKQAYINKASLATSICTVGVGAAMHMQWGGARGSTFGVHMHGGHVAPTAVAMHMQWGGARGSTFGVHMHVAPTVPTVLAAYACDSNGARCAGTASMHMPCVAAYARG